MRENPRALGRPLTLAAAVFALGALCVFLLHGKDDRPSVPAQPNTSDATTAESPRGAARDKPSRGPAAADGAEEADEESDERPDRREKYTASFNRKIERKRHRVANDCAGNEPFAHALDDFDEVRDRIIESAVATDRGLKTQAEQREYERAQLHEFNARMCKKLAGQSASQECKRNFRSCDDVL